MGVTPPQVVASCFLNFFLLLFFNPFRHRIEKLLRSVAPSEPSTSTARLQVIGSSCALADPLPASRSHSHRPGFDHLDRSTHIFSLTDGVDLVLYEATKVKLGFTYMCGNMPHLSGSCPKHACMRPAAPSHASAKPSLSHVLPATACSLMCAQLSAG